MINFEIGPIWQRLKTSYHNFIKTIKIEQLSIFSNYTILPKVIIFINYYQIFLLCLSLALKTNLQHWTQEEGISFFKSLVTLFTLSPYAFKNENMQQKEYKNATTFLIIVFISLSFILTLVTIILQTFKKSIAKSLYRMLCVCYYVIPRVFYAPLALYASSYATTCFRNDPQCNQPLLHPAIILILTFIAFAYSFWLLFVFTQCLDYKTKIAQRTPFTELKLLMNKTIQIIYISALNYGDNSQLANISMAILGISTLYLFLKKMPFCELKINKIPLVLVSFQICFSLCLVINSNRQGSTVLFTLIPQLIMLLIFQIMIAEQVFLNYNYSFIAKNIENPQNVDDAMKVYFQLRSLLLESQGLINEHNVNKSTFQNRALVQILNQHFLENNQNIHLHEIQILIQMRDTNEKEFYTHGLSLLLILYLKQVVQRFPQNEEAILTLVGRLIRDYEEKNFHMIVSYLTFAKLLSRNCYSVEVLQQEIEQEISDSIQNATNQLCKLTKVINLLEMFDNFFDLIRKESMIHRQFWGLFKQTEISAGDIQSLGQQISKYNKKIQDLWKQFEGQGLLKSLHFYLLHGIYQLCLRNDKLSGFSYLKKANDIKTNEQRVNEMNNLNFYYNNILSDDNVLIMMSCDKQEFAQIKYCSSGSSNVFGYESSELIGKRVNVLLLPYMDKKHDNYVNTFLQTGHSELLNQNRRLFAIGKDGYLIPILINIQICPYSKYGFTFVGLTRKLFLSNEIILLNQSGGIEGASFTVGKELGIEPAKSGLNVHITDLCPYFKDILLSNLQYYMDKSLEDFQHELGDQIMESIFDPRNKKSKKYRDALQNMIMEVQFLPYAKGKRKGQNTESESSQCQDILNFHVEISIERVGQKEQMIILACKQRDIINLIDETQIKLNAKSQTRSVIHSIYSHKSSHFCPKIQEEVKQANACRSLETIKHYYYAKTIQKVLDETGNHLDNSSSQANFQSTNEQEAFENNVSNQNLNPNDSLAPLNQSIQSIGNNQNQVSYLKPKEIFKHKLEEIQLVVEQPIATISEGDERRSENISRYSQTMQQVGNEKGDERIQNQQPQRGNLSQLQYKSELKLEIDGISFENESKIGSKGLHFLKQKFKSINRLLDEVYQPFTLNILKKGLLLFILAAMPASIWIYIYSIQIVNSSKDIIGITRLLELRLDKFNDISFRAKISDLIQSNYIDGITRHSEINIHNFHDYELDKIVEGSYQISNFNSKLRQQIYKSSKKDISEFYEPKYQFKLNSGANHVSDNMNIFDSIQYFSMKSQQINQSSAQARVEITQFILNNAMNELIYEIENSNSMFMKSTEDLLRDYVSITVLIMSLIIFVGIVVQGITIIYNALFYKKNITATLEALLRTQPEHIVQMITRIEEFCERISRVSTKEISNDSYFWTSHFEVYSQQPNHHPSQRTIRNHPKKVQRAQTTSTMMAPFNNQQNKSFEGKKRLKIKSILWTVFKDSVVVFAALFIFAALMILYSVLSVNFKNNTILLKQRYIHSIHELNNIESLSLGLYQGISTNFSGMFKTNPIQKEVESITQKVSNINSFFQLYSEDGQNLNSQYADLLKGNLCHLATSEQYDTCQRTQSKQSGILGLKSHYSLIASTKLHSFINSNRDENAKIEAFADEELIASERMMDMITRPAFEKFQQLIYNEFYNSVEQYPSKILALTIIQLLLYLIVPIIVWRPIVRRIKKRYIVLKDVMRPVPTDMIAANKGLLFYLKKLSPKTTKQGLKGEF